MKYSSNGKALKSGVWYTISNFIVKSIGFITTPIFTRLLTKTDFGLYNNYLSWLSIITIFVTLNMESTLISARYDYENTFDEYIFSVLALSAFNTLCWTAVINVFPETFVSWFNLDRVYINGMMLYLFFIPAINLYQARERYYFEYKKSVALSLGLSIGTAVLSVILVTQLNNKLFGRIFGSIIPSVIIGIILYFFFLQNGKRIRLRYWLYALPICLPYIPHLLSLNLLNHTDRVMITKWCSPEDTAMYSLAYTCGSMITLLMVSMNSAYAPWFGERINSGRYDEIRAFAKKYILIFALFAVGFMAIAPEALLIIGGKKYMEAKYVMSPIAMGCVCQFLYTLFVNVEQFKKKTAGMAMASATAALINLVLNMIFIPRVGYLAAAYTTLVGYMCLLLIHMFLVYRLNLNQLYDYKLIGLVLVCMIFITIIMSILYSYTLVRYLIIAIIGVVCCWVIANNMVFFKQFIRRGQ